MAEHSAQSQVFREVPISLPANRVDYVQHRIDEALKYLPEDVSDDAKSIVTETVKMRMAQYGIPVPDTATS
ncbi:MAG TPA: hypothetical protein VH333_05185 [Pseudonocardiaceae bacterium]|jgi:hypothetical protein|nr:hypothetical protein [Pseudonocardiaceae bacterium]